MMIHLNLKRMLNKGGLLCLSMLLIAGYLPAQETVVNKAGSRTLSGYVEDGKTKERLIGVSIYVKGETEGAQTNNFGFYSLSVPDKPLALRISYLGYETLDTMIQAGANMRLTFGLKAEAHTIENVVVTATKQPDLQHSTQMSTIDLSMQTIKSLPAFLGEVDVMKAIQLLPGVQAGTEGSSGIYVRGGGADQNLILLDGVPVYNVSHLFGFFSVFNADAIKNVSIIKGGFPARYAGRLSSVVDITMKEGDKSKLHAEGGIGLLASRLTLEGPIQKGKSSFMISARRTYIDLITGLLQSKDKPKVGYYFYDINGKVNFTLGEKDHVFVSGYFGNDKMSIKSPTASSNLQWGNITAVARWNHEFGPQVFGNFTAYYSRYKFQVSNLAKATPDFPEETSQVNSSYINDKAAKYDLEYTPGRGHHILFGAGYVAHTYEPGVERTTSSGGANPFDVTKNDNRIQSGEIDAYAEDDMRITDKLKSNIGLHWTGYMVNGKFYSSLQPRLSLRYLINDQLSVKAAYSQMNQFVHLLTNSSTGLPTDLWVPATGRIAPELSRQVAAGLAYTHHTGIEVSLEGYYKTMDNVIEYKEGVGFANGSNSWEDKVAVGKGKSYGAELFLQKKQGRFTGMLGYTLSWTTRRFDSLNNGNVFPYRYDRRHDLKIAGVYQWKPNIEVSAEWVFGTGNAITMPTATYRGPDGQDILQYGARNGYRMKPYHRADVSIKFSRQRKHYERAWIISIYNLYARENPFYIYSDGNVFKQVSLFRILPSITYQFKF